MTEGLAKSYEFRLGASALPWPGGIVDLGGTELYRRNGLTGATTTALHPNFGVEQSIPGNAVVVRAEVDETSYGGGITLRRRPLQLDIAYVYDLGRARVGNLFGTTSNSVLATLTFDMSWRATPVVVPPQAQITGASQLICVSTIRGLLECSATSRLTSSDQMRARCSLSALPMTDTELNDIAAAAIIGESRRPKCG